MPLESAAEEDRVKLSGDLRGRWEGFWYSRDESGAKQADRRRIRYRLRLNAEAKINEHAAVAVRVGSNASDSRSGNQTIGDPVDFGPNEITIRRAYLILMPFADGDIPNRDGHWELQFGRVPDPFAWKNGKDMMLIDNDINPGGGVTKFDMALSEAASVFVTAGGFIITENKAAKDPFLAAVQGGLEVKLHDNVEAGVRGSYYHFDYLDNNFVTRGVDGTGGITDGGGNIADGLTGNAAGGDLQVVETQAFVRVSSLPVVAFGGFSNNLSAEASQTFSIDKANLAYNVGLEGGNKKKYVHLGAAYFHIEANAFPSQFIDSDLFDGTTNRRGGMVYGSRQLFKGTDFNVKVFRSDAIETELPAFEDSVKDSERTRLQIDLVYKF
jgi:hypothetical protein